MKFTGGTSLYYDDVTLIAQTSKHFGSRGNVPIEGHRIFVAPMPSIVGPEFILALAQVPKEQRPTLCIPRSKSIQKTRGLIDIAIRHSLEGIFVGVGLDDNKIIEYALRSKCNLLLDTANGYLDEVVDKVEKLSRCGGEVMAGNVHDNVGATELAKSGANLIRVGIGNGSVCSTSFAAGYNRGQITEIADVASCKGLNFQVVADGGIKNPSDIVKAFGCGADNVMVGNIFARCSEAQNRVNGENTYWGLASTREKNDKEGFIEGFEISLDYYDQISLADTLKTLWDGIRSGISYSGYTTVESFIGNGVFERKAK